MSPNDKPAVVTEEEARASVAAVRDRGGDFVALADALDGILDEAVAPPTQTKPWDGHEPSAGMETGARGLDE